MMTDNWNNEEKKRSIMMKTQSLIRLLIKLYLSGATGALTLQMSISLYTINFSRSNDWNHTITFFPSEFFFNIRNSPVYEIVWLCQLAATTVGALAFMDYDIIFIAIVMYLCAQLNILNLDIKNLTCLSGKKTFAGGLEMIVQRHLQLKR